MDGLKPSQNIVVAVVGDEAGDGTGTSGCEHVCETSASGESKSPQLADGLSQQYTLHGDDTVKSSSNNTSPYIQMDQCSPTKSASRDIVKDTKDHMITLRKEHVGSNVINGNANSVVEEGCYLTTDVNKKLHEKSSPEEANLYANSRFGNDDGAPIKHVRDGIFYGNLTEGQAACGATGQGHRKDGKSRVTSSGYLIPVCTPPGAGDMIHKYAPLMPNSDKVELPLVRGGRLPRTPISVYETADSTYDTIDDLSGHHELSTTRGVEADNAQVHNKPKALMLRKRIITISGLMIAFIMGLLLLVFMLESSPDSEPISQLAGTRYKKVPRVVLGGAKMAQFEFNHPWGVTTHNNTIFVADSSNHRVCQLTAAGIGISCLERFGSDGLFDSPKSVVVTGDGVLLVTDNHRVLAFRDDVLVHVWGSLTRGAALGQFSQPHGLATGPGDMIYVADLNNKRVQVLSLSNLTMMWEIRGVAGVGIFSPWDVAISPSGVHVYVVAEVADRHYLLIYDTSGRFVSRLGAETETIFPNGVAVDKQGQVYMTDIHHDCVHIFNVNLTHIQKLGVTGSCSGCFRTPQDLTINSVTGELIVSDYANSNLQIFAQLN